MKIDLRKIAKLFPLGKSKNVDKQLYFDFEDVEGRSLQSEQAKSGIHDSIESFRAFKLSKDISYLKLQLAFEKYIPILAEKEGLPEEVLRLAIPTITNTYNADCIKEGKGLSGDAAYASVENVLVGDNYYEKDISPEEIVAHELKHFSRAFKRTVGNHLNPREIEGAAIDSLRNKIVKGVHNSNFYIPTASLREHYANFMTSILENWHDDSRLVGEETKKLSPEGKEKLKTHLREHPDYSKLLELYDSEDLLYARFFDNLNASIRDFEIVTEKDVPSGIKLRTTISETIIDPDMAKEIAKHIEDPVQFMEDAKQSTRDYLGVIEGNLAVQVVSNLGEMGPGEDANCGYYFCAEEVDAYLTGVSHYAESGDLTVEQSELQAKKKEIFKLGEKLRTLKEQAAISEQDPKKVKALNRFHIAYEMFRSAEDDIHEGFQGLKLVTDDERVTGLLLSEQMLHTRVCFGHVIYAKDLENSITRGKAAYQQLQDVRQQIINHFIETDPLLGEDCQLLAEEVKQLDEIRSLARVINNDIDGKWILPEHRLVDNESDLSAEIRSTKHRIAELTAGCEDRVMASLDYTFAKYRDPQMVFNFDEQTSHVPENLTEEVTQMIEKHI